MWRRPFLMCLLSAAAALPAFAFERPFPEHTKRGTMSPAPYPQIVINERMRQLTMGARIWNEHNLIVMPASLRGANIVVNYTETDLGDIDRIWILKPEEASQSVREQQKPFR